MLLFEELSDENYVLYAAKHYYSPRCIDAEEFYDDLNRLVYVKRLVNRFNRGGDLAERLVLNHITILVNVFGHEAALRLMEFKIGLENWSVIKPFLVFINAIKQDQYTGIRMNEDVVNKLRNI